MPTKCTYIQALNTEFVMNRIYIILFALITIIPSAFADGTKQFMPNCGPEDDPQPKGQCYLALGSREGGKGASRAFARYNSNGESCSDVDRLYIRIADHTKEKIYFGIGGVLVDGAKLSPSGGKYMNSGNEIKYRLRQCALDDPDLSIPVDNGLNDNDADPVIPLNGETPPLATTFMGYNIPTSGNAGFIDNYSKAYYGPNVVNSNGYNAKEITVPRDGLYYLEFYIGHDIGSQGSNKPIDFKYFDVSVVKDSTINNEEKKVQLNGRVYSRSWGLNTNGTTAEAWSTFYTFSTDHYTSKVYLAGVMPYRFVFCCNSFGAINTSSMEENRRSYPDPANEVVQNENNRHPNYIPEYKIFTTAPDTVFYGTAKEPNLPNQLSFAGSAMTCEDLIFVIKLLNNEDATIELYLNESKPDGGENTKVLIDKLVSDSAKARGYHYPWKDMPKLTEAGIYRYSPLTQDEYCPRDYKLSLFDQRFTINSKKFNVGDTVLNTELDLVTINNTYVASEFPWDEPLGSQNNPILISTKEQLKDLATAVNEGTSFSYTIPNLITTKNEDNNTTTTKNVEFTISAETGFENIHFYITAPTGVIKLGTDWPGIGTIAKPFKGHMQAGKYLPDPNETIPANLVGDQDTITIQGSKPLFNVCDGATIENIHVKGDIATATSTTDHGYTMIENTTTNSYGGIGGICAYAKNTTFLHCTNATNLIQAYGSGSDNMFYTGGIVGYADNCTLDSCANIGEIKTINANGSATGGICGFMKNKTTINFCYNAGLLNAESYVGGISGLTDGSTNTIQNCKNINSVSNTNMGAGGVLGFDNAESTNISDCYNSGTITADSEVGGIIGMSPTAPTIIHCYNTGIINSVNDTPYALAYQEEEDAEGTVTYSLSTGTPAIYITTTPSDNTPTAAALGGDEHFYTDDNGSLIQTKTRCCGSSWIQEEAGRLFKNDSLYYLTWDGKFDNGECVTGNVTVNYQKNTGVTHFPFFDPENIKCNDNGLNGLVVYRIRPEETGITPEELPLNYYRTDKKSSEKGVEMKLYWDDSKIFYPSACNKTLNRGDLIGKTVSPAVDSITHTFKNSEGADSVGKTPIKFCINVNKKVCAKQSSSKITTFDYHTGKYKREYYCETVKAGKTCTDVYMRYKVSDGSTVSKCQGIDNSRNGYYGSNTGHIFPIETTTSDGYGNKHIINTWWNGIEKKGENTLTLNAFSPAQILPIVISKWTATSLPKTVLLEWTTASEENNDYFTIERSIDGMQWNSIGRINGAGTSSSTHTYSLEDTKPVAGISYYRLKQTDFNGKSSYSSVKCVNRPEESEEYFKAYTNERENSFIIEGESIAACTIEVYDITGRKVTNVSFNPINTSKVSINVASLPLGAYIITCCNQSKTLMKNWK